MVSVYTAPTMVKNMVTIKVSSVPSTSEIAEIWQTGGIYSSHSIHSIDDYLRNDWKSEFRIELAGNEVFYSAIINRYHGNYGINISNIWHQWTLLLQEAEKESHVIIPIYPVTPINDTLAFQLKAVDGSSSLSFIDLENSNSIFESIINLQDLIDATSACRNQLKDSIESLFNNNELPIRFNSLDFNYFLPNRIDDITNEDAKKILGTNLIRTRYKGIDVEGKLNKDQEILEYYPIISWKTLSATH
jgi:hypothetical protein